MASEITISIPRRVPAMTLPDTVFFPQAMLPLHIFEKRYRKMLKDVLSNHRMFAVTALDESAPAEFEQCEPHHQIATLGMVRACRKNEDKSSNVILQGISRVRVARITSESPYRAVEIQPLASVPGKKREALLRLKGRLLGYINVRRRLGWPVSKEMLAYLKTLEEPDLVADMAAFSVLEDRRLKQELLETLDTSRRLERMIDHFTREIDELRLRRKLQGSLDDDDIWMN